MHFVAFAPFCSNPQSAKEKTNRRWTRINTDGKALSLSAFIRGSNPQSAKRNFPEYSSALNTWFV